MDRLRRLTCASLALAAGATAVPDLPGIGRSNSGALHGFDIISRDQVGVGTAPPGAYEEARAPVLDRGPACPDDSIRAVGLNPPENGFSTLTARCPDPGRAPLAVSRRVLIAGP